MGRIPRSLGAGLVTSRDPSTLRDGELSVATGCEYKPGSPHLHKQPGRTSTSSTLGAAVRAINKLQYDSTTDALVAVAGGTVYESAVSTSPAWTASSVTTLTTSAIPRFSSMQDRWYMVDGVDANYVRDPDGTWRANGLQPPGIPVATPSASTGATTRPENDAGASSGTNWTNPDNARDSDSTTYAYTATTGAIYTWSFTSAAYSSAYLYVDLAMTGGSRTRGGALSLTDDGWTQESRSIADTAKLVIEYSIDGGTNWTTLNTSSGTVAKKALSVLLTDGTYVLQVRATHTTVSGLGGTSYIYDVRASTGAGATTVVTNPIYYGVTEIYTTADGLEYESNISTLTAAVQGTYAKVTITLPARKNTHTTSYGVYRSVDTSGGGYPNLWRLAKVPYNASALSWLDDFSLTPSTTPDGGTYPLYPTLEMLSPTGDTLIIETNGAPPLAKLALPYQGSMMYFPAATQEGSRVYYSLPSGTDKTAIEKVPDYYYLEFTTPKNDIPISGAVTNGGRTAIVFFSDYTMIVNYLPQATDPNIFDTRINEYVSNMRGAAGVGCVAEFTLPGGQTLVAAVDALGLWVTNGVNVMTEWSRDLDWTTDLAGVTLSSADLVDNPEMRRLEFLYTTAAGTRAEYHFYYGRTKDASDGENAPLITGPHPMGVRCKHYTQVSGVWEGFSGDASTTGDVFVERDGDEDEADGYNSSGHIPFRAKTGDIYVGGLGGAHLVECAYPKFAAGTKDVSLVGTFVRDSGTTKTVTKTYSVGTQKKTYWHRYADRHAIEVQDISATSMPALVGYEVEVRDAGEGRDT